MPPELELLENQDTGETALWNPESESFFNYPKTSQVIQHKDTGQQAIWDTGSKSIIAYLPRRVKAAAEAPTITKEYPVEYAGRVGVTPYKPFEEIGDVFRTGIEEVSRPGQTESLSPLMASMGVEREIAPIPSPMGRGRDTRLTDIRPEEKPSLLERLAISPAGNVAMELLKGAARPVQLATEYLAKPLTPFPELLKPETYEIGEGESPEEAGRRVMGAIAQPFPEIVSKPIEAVFEATRKVSPAAANVLEGLMLYGMTGAAGPHAARPRIGPIVSRAFERIKGRRPTSQAEVAQAIREEPAFTEELRKAREEQRTGKIGPIEPTEAEVRPPPETIAPEAPGGPGTTIRPEEGIGLREGVPAFISAARRQELADLGYRRDEITKMTPAEADSIVQAQRTASREVPRAETQPPEVEAPAVQAAKAETYQGLEPEKLTAKEVVAKIEDQQAPEHFDKPKITKQVEKGGETYVKTEVDPEALKVPGEKTVEPGISVPEKGPIVVDDKGKVIDGRHRVVDAKEAGEPTIEAYVPEKAVPTKTAAQVLQELKSKPLVSEGSWDRSAEIRYRDRFVKPLVRTLERKPWRTATDYANEPPFNRTERSSSSVLRSMKELGDNVEQAYLKDGTPVYALKGTPRPKEVYSTEEWSAKFEPAPKAAGELQAKTEPATQVKLSAEPTPSVKQPWEMTQQDFIEAVRQGRDFKQLGIDPVPLSRLRAAKDFETLDRQAKRHHKGATTMAVARGEVVPPEVLAEYPDLAKGAIQPSVTPKRGPGIEEPTQVKPLEPEGGTPRIVYDDSLSSDVGGFYDPKTNEIRVSTKLSPERASEIINHEFEHARQSGKGILPSSTYVLPEKSIKLFMEYFADPSEVKARAAEKGEAITDIWNVVFKLREQSMKGELGTIEPLVVQKVAPVSTTKFIPERPVPESDYANWQTRRLTNSLRKTDPRPIETKQKSVRVFFENQGNGIIAESKLREVGIEASSNAPFSVDVPVNDSNMKALQQILGTERKSLPSPSTPPIAGGEVPTPDISLTKTAAPTVEPRNVAAQPTIGPTERRAQLEQAIADGEMRLRTRKNAIGERLSGKEIAATRKAVAGAKRELAQTERPVPSKVPLTPEEKAVAEEWRGIFGARGRRETVKVVKPPRERVATYDQSLALFMQNSGGISIARSPKEAGELRARRQSAKGKQIINAKGGMTADEAAQLAQEAGFIEESSARALLEALDREIEGKPVFSVKGSRRERLMDLEAERELERGFEAEEAELRKPRTPFDTPEIIEARMNQEVSPQTIEINTPERNAFRERLADQFYGEGAANKARRADIIIGPSGAGKSTIFVKPLAEQHGSLTIDPDFVKPAIPEYAGGRQAGIVHKESASIVEDRILPRAVVNGDNIVYPVTGKNTTRIQNLVSELKKAGYSIHLHLLDLPAEKAAQRVVDRFKETNRFIDPEGVLKVGLNPRKTFDTLKKEADSYEAYTADVPFGERPRLLERGPGAEEVAGRRLRGGVSPEGLETGQPTTPKAQTEVKPAFEPTEAGAQALIPGTEGREIPRAPLRPKVQQAEGPLELERPGIEKQQPGLFAEPKPALDLSTASLTDLVKKGFGSETGTVGKLTPEQLAIETEARAARKELYRRVSAQAAETGETLEAVAERMKLPPGALQRLQAEQEPPPRGFVTSIKNVQVDKELAELGLPPATHGERVSFEDARAAAERMVQADPFAGKKLVDDLSRQPRPVTATEDALLLTEQTRLKNERIQAENALIEAQKSGDQTAIGEARARVDAARADFMTIGDVVTKVGTESSLSLGHRRMMMKEDYSLAAMERTKQISKGRPLTEAELAEVKTLNEKMTATQKAFDEYVAKAELEKAEAESAATHFRLLAESREKPTVVIDPAIQSLVERVVASMESQADAARVRLREKLSRLHAGLDPTIVTDMSIIGAAKIARVGLDFGRWSKAMVEDLGEKIRPYLQAAWEASNKRLESHIGRMAGGKKEPVERVIKGTDLAEQREAAKGQLRAKVESGEDIFPQAQTLARLFVEQGIKERGALIDAVHGELKEVMPDITRRQVMDAISGYGRYRQLSKDEISVELRDLKGQMQQVAKLEDIQSREPPLKTGVERRIPTDEERRLIQQVNEAKRRFGVVVTDPATQLQSALGARKTYYRNQISDLEAQIAAKEKFVKEKTASPTDSELEGLKIRRNELKEEFDRIFGTPGLTDAQRVAMAVRGLAKSITDLEQRIKTGDIGPRTRVSKTPSIPELEAMRARRDALREQLQELRDAATPKKTPEQIALQSLKTRLANQTADMMDRLARGDFTKKPKRVVQMDPEAQRLAFENAKVRQQYHEGLMKDQLARRTVPQKIIGGVGEVLNTSRAILTGLDLSAVLRQGGFTAFGHPIRAAKVFPAMFRALLSEKGQHAVNQEILSRENYPLYKRSKLYLAEHGQSLSQMEEAYMSRWAEKIPLVAASQRAYTTFLNRLRADSFDAMVRSLGRTREVTAEEASAIANFVNVSTGRGSLGMRENAAVGLNTVFFAPRYVASRFQLIVGQPFYRGTARTRELIAQEYARYLIGLGMVYGLAEMSGAEIETDSRSSDFGKIKIGNTRIDPLSGLSQATVLLSRLATGETKTLRRDKVVPIRGEKVPYGGGNAADVIARFLRSKLSPVVGTTVNVLAGKDVVGDPITPESAATNLVVPLAMQDIYDAMVEQGAPRGAALGLLATFGMGLQTFDERKRKQPERRTFGQRLEHFGERLGLGTAP